MSNLKHLDLFSGIGGFSLAGKWVGGFETVQFVEIDSAVQETLKKNFPGIPIHDDITTFSAIGKRYDLITAGFPCFVAGTMILTFEGYRPIEEIECGDVVLTHTGQWKAVTHTMSKSNAPLREIKALGTHSLITTDEHPFYAIKRSKQWNNSDRKYDYSFTDPLWVESKNLTTQHYLAQVLPPEIYDEKSESFWKLVGLYLADGWRVRRLDRVDGSGRVVVCANKLQSLEVEKIISDAGFNFSKCEERTAYKYHITNNAFYNFLEQFGHKADGKSIPGWVLGISQEKALALMEGLIYGDGWRNSYGHARITTVSQKLAYSAALMAQKAYGCIASVFYAEVPDQKRIEGRLVNQKAQFIVQITFNNLEKRSFLDGNYGWKRIRANRTLGSNGTVYNLTVDDDNSYIANGAIVHNCQDLSVAGHGVGLVGKRSGLFYEVIRLISECRPSYVLLENVAALLNSNNGRDMGAVLWELSQVGYDAEWEIIPASALGANHARERLWIAAYPNSIGRSIAERQERRQIQERRVLSANDKRQKLRARHKRNELLKAPRSGQIAQFPRADDGVSDRVDEAQRRMRIKALGNSIVPQVAMIPLQRIRDLHNDFQGEPE